MVSINTSDKPQLMRKETVHITQEQADLAFARLLLQHAERPEEVRADVVRFRDMAQVRRRRGTETVVFADQAIRLMRLINLN